MRITVLANTDTEGGKDWDAVVDQVVAALQRKDHKVSVLGVFADIPRLLDGLREQKPDLVFNLVEEFGTTPVGNLAICGILEVLRLPYTGCGPGEYFLGQDKALAKKLLAFDSILFPKFAVFHKDKDFETGGNLRMPMFVKPVAMDASIGIGRKSLVKNSTELMERVLAIHKDCNDAALAEEYIEGREFYVGVLGNLMAKALPPIELDFSSMPAGRPHVYGSEEKWDENSKVLPHVADIPDELRARLQKVSLDAYRSLRVRDYGRVDLRVADTGEIYVLEVNASCYLAQGDEFCMAAEAAGIPYDDLVDQIAHFGLARYGK